MPRTLYQPAYEQASGVPTLRWVESLFPAVKKGRAARSLYPKPPSCKAPLDRRVARFRDIEAWCFCALSELCLLLDLHVTVASGIEYTSYKTDET